jgi:hypothetical protein
MLENERALYAFLLDYARMLAADIDEAELARQPVSGMNHPAWILGHLALCTDFALMLLGEPKACPKEWSGLFGPGSTLTTDRAAYPSKADLLAALESGHERVGRAAERIDPARLGEAHPFRLAFLEGKIDTVGLMLAHLLTTHEAAHLGQLSAWRRAMGMPGVLSL